MGVLLKSYQTADLFDELMDPKGEVRPYYQTVANFFEGLPP